MLQQEMMRVDTSSALTTLMNEVEGVLSKFTHHIPDASHNRL